MVKRMMQRRAPLIVYLFIILHVIIFGLIAFDAAQWPPPRPAGLRPLTEYESDEVYAKCGFPVVRRGTRDVAIENVTDGIPPLEQRIIDGTPAGENEFPAAVYVRLTNPDGRAAICGGTLITRRHVITAQHCFTHLP